MTIADEVGIIREILYGKASVQEAAKEMGTSVRTVWRKVARYRKRGAEGLIHGLTGRPSNRSKPAHVKQQVIELYQRGHQGIALQEFTRTLLAEGQGIEVCRETVRQWLIDAGMWTGRKG